MSCWQGWPHFGEFWCSVVVVGGLQVPVGWWEEGRVLLSCTHLSVLPLQWRRAAFPGQVSGTIGSITSR